ncbi:AAA family ATPase [Hymenobacter mucosus]|uniref:Uncharacterized protein n=1 Tax=Hymenobacter mucosus TaxID=1411120 RepID=A0A239A8E6_9BACT|nr:hypothetical protein [Hymenobacter mucosus]SNR91887.1 hypothetical protein SAMN06269173_11159 [Hymenobacter mucosus]
MSNRHRYNPNPLAALDPAPLPGRTVRPTPTAPTTVPLPIQTLEDILAAATDFYLHGTGNGETTHWPCLDEFWTWLRKEITAITGYANQGKSRWIMSVMLLKAVFSDWKFVVCIPENEDDFYVEMAEILVGMTSNVKFSNNRMSLDQLQQAIRWLYDHFRVVTTPEGATPAQLLDRFAELHAETPFDGLLIDPWNQLTHEFQSREDLYLSTQFSLLKRFAIKHNMAVIITAHPGGDVKDKNGKLQVPNAYSISGGKMWANKFDNVLAVFRPNFPESDVELWIHKIKKRGRVGKPGQLDLLYDVKKARYFPQIGDMQHPLEACQFNAPGTPPSVQHFPPSEFDRPSVTVNNEPAPF